MKNTKARIVRRTGKVCDVIDDATCTVCDDMFIDESDPIWPSLPETLEEFQRQVRQGYKRRQKRG